MIPFLRPPFRSSGGSTIPTLSSAAVTILGLKVTRHQILRISGLLALRSLVGLIDIPLDDSVQAYLWTFLFSSAQAGVALATAASLFDFGTVSNKIFGRFFPSTVDEPFVTFYCYAVLVVGPIVSCFETAIIVYEIMNMARKAEKLMFETEQSGGKFVRPVLLSGGIGALSAIAAIAYVCMTLTQSWLLGIMPVAVVSTVLLIVSGITEDANVIESCFIGLYSSCLWLVAMMEEATLGGSLIQALGTTEAKKWADQDNMRAGVLISSLLCLLLSMSRLERFIKVLTFGHDVVLEQEEQQVQQQETFVREDENEDVDKDNQSSNSHAHAERRRSQSVTRQTQKMRPVVSAITLIAATFRILVWAGQIAKGEYLPIACRGWQMLMSIFLYIAYVRS